MHRVHRVNGTARLIDATFSRLIAALAIIASLMLLAMMLVICADVLLRNVALPGLPRGVGWSNEVSELMLYGIAMLSAPLLLRQGRHIRVDILLRVLPPKVAYGCEWTGDITGFLCCLWMVWYGSAATFRSYSSGAQSIKTLVMPEWWFLAPLPACFALLACEFVFRMQRLATGPAQPRDDAVSAA